MGFSLTDKVFSKMRSKISFPSVRVLCMNDLPEVMSTYIADSLLRSRLKC
jgi:hypothetical protein